ncbi:MAG: hypothetical protein ISR29_00395 [SAR86 cluster bacterium]|uniref:Uncharacterized protein n=1 Tax=SAR86 cluster bacterium TaxID=2030880 RepID=A0A937J4U5_9GAMM|nr:hypothetical protein [SAR86 cluster bacterium]
MKYFLQSFSFTFLMYFGLWIMWVHFAIDIGLDAEYPGSLVYLPHAARVICTCIFGWYAIPAMVAADFIAITFFVHGNTDFLLAGSFSFEEFINSVVANSSVFLSLLLLKLSGLSFTYHHAALTLKKSNYRHVFLITVISAFINGLVGNFIRQGLNDYDIHLYTVLRFTVGDILGTLVVLLVCTIMLSAYTDIINKSNKTN